MRAAHKILATAAFLALGAGGLLLLRYRQKLIAADAPRSTTPALPAIALAKDDAERLTKIELTSTDDSDGDGARRLTITMEKRGPAWELTAPIVTGASSAKVGEAIQNLETLHLWKQLDPGTSYYDQYDLTEGKALHIVAWRGAAKVVDLFCGKGSTDGQLVRLPDRDGMFALVNWGPQGYAGFLFTRDLRSWRETSIFNFAPEDAVGVEIRNAKGRLVFAKTDGRWLATRNKPKPDGQPGRAAPWRGFDQTKIDTLLRDYRALAAEDFGDGVSHADAGVDDAERTGGVIRIDLKSGAALTLRVGKLANNRTRWAIKDGRWAIKDGGDGTLYALAPWPAAWATAEAQKFE
jgi:Domain of unknown function (DUF4340)